MTSIHNASLSLLWSGFCTSMFLHFMFQLQAFQSLEFTKPKRIRATSFDLKDIFGKCMKILSFRKHSLSSNYQRNDVIKTKVKVCISLRLVNNEVLVPLNLNFYVDQKQSTMAQPLTNRLIV